VAGGYFDKHFWGRQVAYPAYVDALVSNGYQGYMDWEFCHPALENGKPAGIEYVVAVASPFPFQNLPWYLSADRNDGSCGSCHKQKTGTLAGTLSNGALTLTLDFPEGGTDITPLCGITMHVATSDMSAGRIAATYTGTTTCEGPISDGRLTVTR